MAKPLKSICLALVQTIRSEAAISICWVRTSSAKQGILARIRMAAQLKWLLGDQKIDIVGDYEESPIVKEALEKGIRLV